MFMSILNKAISELCTAQDSRALISIYHLKAYIIGVQTALRFLNLSKSQDNVLYDTIHKQICKKYGKSHTEYISLWMKSMSPKDSVVKLLVEIEIGCGKCSESLSVAGTNNYKPTIINIMELLPAIEKRPQIYVYSAEIMHLRAYFEGLNSVARVIGHTKIEPDLVAFELWLRKQIQPESCCSWDMLILSACGGDGVMAFRKFFEYLRLFQKVNSGKGATHR